jgi:putative ABC transport system ATP-binding protein
MTGNLIEIRKLSKRYGSGDGEVPALQDVDLTIRRGEFVAIVGPSGSGKSTLMNIIGLMDRPTAGRYLLDGHDVSRLNRDERAVVRGGKIGFVFQSFQLLPRLSALENVLLGLLYRPGSGQSEKRDRDHAVTALKSVGLGERLHHRPSQLSGGQQQRVAIARALVNRPPLILADEPTGNLDSKSGGEVMDLLHALQARGVTLVMVTHEPDMAAHAQREIHIRDGRVVHDRPTSSWNPFPAVAAGAIS